VDGIHAAEEKNRGEQLGTWFYLISYATTSLYVSLHLGEAMM